MKLSRLTPTQQFDIREPRWHDRTVLLASYKVGTHNEVKFRAPSMPGNYYVSGVKVKQCKLNTNGKINCYAVPLDDLEPLERD